MTENPPQTPVPNGTPFADPSQPADNAWFHHPSPGPLDTAAQTTATGPSTPVAEDTEVAAGTAAPPKVADRASRRRGPPRGRPPPPPPPPAARSSWWPSPPSRAAASAAPSWA